MDNIELKMSKAQKDQQFEKNQDIIDAAYVNRNHLLREQQDIQRANNHRKAQNQNLKKLKENECFDKQAAELHLVDKIATTDQLMQKKMKLTETNPHVGINLYMDLNKASFKYDQEQRNHKEKQNYDHII